MTTHWIDRLSEYHDGELSPAEQTACESHLAACAECRSVLAEIRDVVAMARTDGEQLPACGLGFWRRSIQARLTTSAKATMVRRSFTRRRKPSRTTGRGAAFPPGQGDK
jgi:anti-sigma factor RsiW